MIRLIPSSLVSVAAVAILNMQPIQNAAAQGVYAYPNAGQSPEQQQRDSLECHQWAVQQSGYDPQNPPAAPVADYNAPPPPRSGGFLGLGQGGMFGEESGMLGDAGTGAALGAAGGAIAGSPGTGAAIGALAGTLIGGVERSNRQEEEARWRQQQQRQAQERQRQAAQQRQHQAGNYNRAFRTCMSSRKYTVG